MYTNRMTRTNMSIVVRDKPNATEYRMVKHDNAAEPGAGAGDSVHRLESQEPGGGSAAALHQGRQAIGLHYSSLSMDDDVDDSYQVWIRKKS
ncbi:hypothetical protein GW17_00056422 [Ensete ventricosum]|nr:hypothetical protein GW17_00056422 [Ensete ventricosum]